MNGYTATVRHETNGIVFMVTGVSRADAIARAAYHLVRSGDLGNPARYEAVLRDVGVVTVGDLTARVTEIVKGA